MWLSPGELHKSLLPLEVSVFGGYSGADWSTDEDSSTRITGSNGFAVVVPRGRMCALLISLSGSDDVISYALTVGGVARMDGCTVEVADTRRHPLCPGFGCGLSDLCGFDDRAGSGGSGNGTVTASGTARIRNSWVVAPVSQSGSASGIRNEGTLLVENSVVESGYTTGDGNGILQLEGESMILGGQIASANSGGSAGLRLEEGVRPCLERFSWGLHCCL